MDQKRDRRNRKVVAMRGMIRHQLIASLFGVLAGTSAWAQADETAVIPRVHGTYQQKLEMINAGSLPRLFLGAASVVPDRSQPFMVSLGLKQVRTELGHFCGGAIVARNWVLTAAHCVSAVEVVDGRNVIVPMAPGGAQVMEGSNVLFRDGQIRLISRIVIHPEHRLSARQAPENDLALLQLSAPLDAKPVRVATATESEKLLQAGRGIRILGWGTANFTADSPISNNLLFAFVGIRDRTACNAADVYAGAVDASMFCAGLGTADACQGDSGGPAIGYINGEPLLVGLISWGVGCTKRNFPGVYVNVAKYDGWIHATIKSGNP